MAALAVYLVLWLKVTATQERGSDFSVFYVAALLVRAGHGDQVYNQAIEAARHAAILPRGYHLTLPFNTPPTSALLAIPLTLLNPGTAYRLFSVAQFLLLGAAVWVAARAAPWPKGEGRARSLAALAGLAGTATFPLLILGQWDGVCALGLALAYAAWRRDRRFAAGLFLALGLGIAKPHLAVGLIAFVIGRRDWRALLGALAGAALLGVASVATVGVATTLAFLGNTAFALGHTPASSTLGLLGLASSWLGSGDTASILALAGGGLGIAAAFAIGWRSRGRPELLEVSLAAAVALTLLVSPHLLPHDLALTAPAFVWLSARAARLDEPQPWPGRRATAVLAGWLTMAVLVALDLGNSAQAPPGRVVPWGLMAAAVILFVWQSRSPMAVPTG